MGHDTNHKKARKRHDAKHASGEDIPRKYPPARANGRARALRLFSELPTREQRLALQWLTALARDQ